MLLVLAGAVRGGTLTLRDGKTVSGDLTVEGARIIVTPRSGPPQGFELPDVAQATFSAPPGPTTTYVAPSKETTYRSGPRKILAEYFSDREMKDLRLRRYEGKIDGYHGPDSPPDPSLPGRYGVRYSFQVLPPASGEYAFAVSTTGPVRLWINDELKIDQWDPAGEKNSRAAVTLTQNKPAHVRMETYGAQYGFKAVLRLYGQGFNNGYLSSDHIAPPADAPAQPVVSIASPKRGTHYLSPEKIDFEFKAEDPAGAVQRVEVWSERTLIGTATSAPWRVEWKNPPAGYYFVMARAFNDKGICNHSDVVGISIANAGENNTLPAPWGQLTLTEKKDQRPPGTAAFDKGAFKLSRAGGQITEGDDGFLFVYQALSGDFEISARLASLAPADNFVGPLAGLMIRDSLRTDGRFAAAVISPTATTFARKVEGHSKIAATHKENATAPAWLKLTRYANRVRIYTSTDGREWNLFAGERFELPEHLFVGLCTMARSKETAANALFEHVSIVPGVPQLLHATEGAYFRSGTFLACEVHGLKEGSLIYSRGGKRLTLPANDVARLVYKAVPLELAESVPADRSGVLLGSGDFIDGDIKEVNYRATVSNLVFGPRTFSIRTNDVLAVYLRDAKPQAAPYTLIATDGSVLQARSIKAEQDALLIDEITLGAMQLPLKDVAQLKVN